MCSSVTTLLPQKKVIRAMCAWLHYHLALEHSGNAKVGMAAIPHRPWQEMGNGKVGMAALSGNRREGMAADRPCSLLHLVFALWLHNKISFLKLVLGAPWA